MITQIFWLLSWPLLIAFSFYAVNWMLKRFGQNNQVK